jgi:predicted 3-demethylubiquinone-9 3-methyltransferase (glyoxalase superfamily)
MTTITPFLWFEGKAEEAVSFYTAVFKDSKVGYIKHFGDYMPGPKGEVMTGRFTLCGQDFMILNGGPNGDQKFTEAISFFITVDTQEEIDYYWQVLTADSGKPGLCGWLKDKYGLSWQITPKVMEQFMNDPDIAKAERVTKAMLTMDKINIADLQAAYDQK